MSSFWVGIAKSFLIGSPVPSFEEHVRVLDVADSPEDQAPVEVTVVEAEAEVPLDRDGGVRLDHDLVEAEVVEGRGRKARFVLLRDPEETGHAVSRKKVAKNRI